MSVKMLSGIYKIINKSNGKFYIGSSNNIQLRWNIHKSELRRNTHHNNYLQHAWNKYGEDNFIFEIIEIIPKGKLIESEQKYLDKIDRNQHYNLSSIAGKVEINDETRKKMSESHKGEKNHNFGNQMSSKMKKILRKSNLGRKLTDDHKKKIGQSQIGKNNAFFGKTHTEEVKNKIRKAMKKRWAKFNRRRN